LLPNEKSAEDKEEVNTDPAEVSNGEDARGELTEDRQVIEHDDDDSEHTECVEAEEPGRCSEEFHLWVSQSTDKPKLLHRGRHVMPERRLFNFWIRLRLGIRGKAGEDAWNCATETHNDK
jgi:hypothetical protein